MRPLAMWREIATVVVGLALVLVAIGVVFFVGMRTDRLSCAMWSAGSIGPSATRTR